MQTDITEGNNVRDDNIFEKESPGWKLFYSGP